MFLLRTAFWLAVVIMLIPVDEELAASRQVLPDVDPVGAAEAVGAASAALSDAAGFCDRNPDVCDIGGRAAETFSLKARSAALMAYRFFDGQLGGSGEPPPAEGSAVAGAGTLTPSDLESDWSGPAPDGSI